MTPIFTIHAGEYLVGEYLQKKYPQWDLWVPAKDRGIDLLASSKTLPH
jgi:hypothetical protein